jgi:transcriptional regulator with XRE-family HTH domain
VNPTPQHHDIFLKQLGVNLRRIRNDKGFTMQDLADEAKIDYRQLGRIERGEINTSVVSLLRLAEVLKIDIKTLFEFKD